MIRQSLALLVGSFSMFAAEQHLTEGASASPVRVIIYEDLQCPDCAEFRVMLDKQLLPRYATTVRFEHRDFPLAKHVWARKAAIAARYFEETKPGAGLAFRKYALGNLSDITAENFDERLAGFAKENRIDPAKALAALSDERLAGLVEKDYQEGLARGVAHTPTVLVNGIPFIETFQFEDVAKTIESQLAASK
jgi:protein-disulfide isomerase